MFSEFPIKWSFYLLIFYLGYVAVRYRSIVERFAQTLMWTVFFLSLTAIPALLMSGNMGYEQVSGRVKFFPPFMYSNTWVTKYILAPFAHPNWVGDVLAFGFFAALGMAIYLIFIFVDKKKRDFKLGYKETSDRVMLGAIALRGFIALVVASAILLIFSRGTISFWVFSLVLYLLMLTLKIRSRKVIITTFIFFLAVVFFGSWAGNLKDAITEVSTLVEEKKALTGKHDVKIRFSIDMNREGARIAKAMHQEFPVWGVGTDGFEKRSKRYFIKGVTENYNIAKKRAMSHYLHVLAEEGIGAFLYFLFLTVYGIEVIIRFIKTRSRYQFLMGLSLSASVFLVLAHASINHIMQTFAVSSLVYLVMGASLGILLVPEACLAEKK